MNAPTVVSLFSGIGGFDLGLERAGFRVVAQVENDPFCQRVLAARWPGVSRFGDVRTLAFAHEAREQFPERVDLLCGGFPCQDLSVAGKRAGLGGSRSSLFWEYVRLAKALTPTFGLVENVPGLLSSHRGRDFWAVLSGLRDCWPVVGWRILDSQHFGVPQRRRRVFLVGGPTEQSVAEILALTDSGGGDSPASGEAGSDTASTLGVGSASTRPNFDGDYVTGPLGGGNDGIGRRSEDDPNLVVAATLNSGGNDGGFRTEPGEHLIAFRANDGREMTTYEDQAPTLQVSSGGWAGAAAVAQGLPKQEYGLHVAPTRAASLREVQAAIRRLTPLECERLQGFPDGWTCLCTPLEAYAADPDEAALACRCPDSSRYRSLGNAVTVPVIHWLARRLRATLS